MTPVLTAPEVASMLQCTERTVSEHASAGVLPGIKFGAAWVFPAQALTESLNRLAQQQADMRAAPVRPKAAVKQSRPNLVGL